MPKLNNTHNAIIHFLGNNGETTKSKLAEKLKLGWATTNQHVNELYKWGYIKARKEDGKIYWKVIE